MKSGFNIDDVGRAALMGALIAGAPSKNEISNVAALAVDDLGVVAHDSSSPEIRDRRAAVEMRWLRVWRPKFALSARPSEHMEFSFQALDSITLLLLRTKVLRGKDFPVE